MADDRYSAGSGDSKLPLRYIDGPDYCTVKDATGKDFALTVQPEFMKAMEKALSDEIASLMRAPAQAWQLPKSLPLEGFASQPSPAATVETSPPGQVRADFLAYWNKHQACPEHSLTTENAAHACWQEAYKKYAPHSGSSADTTMEGRRDAIVQAIHAHVGIRQRINVDLTGVEGAADAILCSLNEPASKTGDRK